MEEKQKLSGLSDYRRYSLESLILEDPNVSEWFVDLCMGKPPSAKVSEETLALMEGRGLIRKTDFGWALGADGRQFARNLGLISGPSRFETDLSLLENVVPKSEAELRAKSRRAPYLEKTWRDFIKTRDERYRNLLMEYYSPLVKYAANRIYKKLPHKVELDDLISAGIFGLMDAIDAFDPDKNVKFETYCMPRIRGSILDELRSMDWVPRLVRARAHQLTRATRSLETNLGRKPTEKETAEELDMDTKEFNRLLRDANAVRWVSLESEFDERKSEEDIDETDEIKGDKVKDPMIEVQKRDLKNLLTKGLTRAEQLIIIYYYYEEMTMKEIGRTLDLSESRVSQIHSSILARLRAQMKGRGKENLVIQ